MINGWMEVIPVPTGRRLGGQLNRRQRQRRLHNKEDFPERVDGAMRWRYRNFSIQVAIQFISIPPLLFHSFYNHYFILFIFIFTILFLPRVVSSDL